MNVMNIILWPYISSRFGSYDVVANGFKYTHCYLINLSNYLIVTFTINVAFVTRFSR
jgi:hypothetical protein